jgi:glucosamine kinase
MRHLVIDAGQSGARSCLLEDGRVIGRFELPGVVTARPIEPQLADAITSSARGDLDLVTIGSTGFLHGQTDPAVVRSLSGARKVLIAHDSVTAFLGALGAERGAVIAVGTGVVTLAVGASAFARVDGWGHLVGDAGSGYWIGRAALRAVMRAYDGRGPATALSDRVLPDFAAPESMYLQLQQDPDWVRRVASYSTVVVDLYDTDDVARHICAAAAAELATSVLAALSRVSDISGARVCGIGGVLRSTAMSRLFHAELGGRAPSLHVHEARGDGLDGAATLADVTPSHALHPLIARA